ncbi:ABC transporter [Salinibacter sp. 10B]|uniref:ABC transporter ATP-binding protein n=1 Tax=Salinibacter sp. 10B TaxID=1923971 RepID=UPI000CF4D0E2|nr:ATP-binding cassette domain-containing protein [Salinibacter sp. 10B]PQJ34668.1 ABC transporter [Salinibacter sp. 10B]
MAHLSVENVTKRYGDTVAVDDVSFEAEPGRILGLLGPNGAGKTSTIRMITYIMVPDAGTVRYEGQTVGPWSQQRMGYLPEERGLYKRLRVKEQLVYLGTLKGLSKTEAATRADHWLDRFDATDWADMKTEELSKGMQQKIQFIATLLHDPSLLIFDEPFSGLDPINADLLRDIILELRRDDRTILFASHRMEQVEQLCDDICLMAQGDVVLQGNLRDIKEQFGKNTLVLEFDGDDTFVDELEASGQVRVNTRNAHRVELSLADGTDARSVLDLALDRTEEVYRYERVAPPLNEIFVEVVGESEARRMQEEAVETA